MQPKGRYIKLNIVDYLLIAVLALLLVAMAVRGIGLMTGNRADTCRAEVEFVIRDLDEDSMSILTGQQLPFYLQDGSLFAGQYTATIHRTTEVVRDENGNMQEAESLISYKVTFSFTAQGSTAKDGTFLLNGIRRLSIGETFYLTRESITYTADIVRVSIQTNGA